MGILSHTKRCVCERRESNLRRHSEDGELDLSGPLLIYRHGLDMPMLDIGINKVLNVVVRAQLIGGDWNVFRKKSDCG